MQWIVVRHQYRTAAKVPSKVSQGVEIGFMASQIPESDTSRPSRVVSRRYELLQ